MCGQYFSTLSIRHSAYRQKMGTSRTVGCLSPSCLTPQNSANGFITGVSGPIPRFEASCFKPGVEYVNMRSQCMWSKQAMRNYSNKSSFESTSLGYLWLGRMCMTHYSEDRAITRLPYRNLPTNLVN